MADPLRDAVTPVAEGLGRRRSSFGARHGWPSGPQVPPPIPCGTMPFKEPSSEERAAGYGDLHATVIDAIRYVTAGQSIEEAADEVLQRLRDAGLPIPDRP